MKTSTFVLLAAALLLPRTASAEAPSTPGRDRARTFLVIRMAEELDLSDEKALQVSAVLRRSEDRRRELTAQRDQIESQLRAALEQSPPNDADLGKLVGQANDVDQQLSQVVENSYREVQKLLTVEQQAKLVLFRPQLRKQVRGALRKRLEGSGGTPGPGGFRRRHVHDD